MKVMREMKARFVKDYVLFIEGASFFFLCNASDWQSSSSLRRTGGVINLDWEEKRRRGNRGERVQKVLWGRKTSKSAFFIRLVYCKTGINLENIHAYIHTRTHAHMQLTHAHKHCKLHLHEHWGKQPTSQTRGISGKMYIQMGRDGEAANGRPIRVETMSCCYCFNQSSNNIRGCAL